MWATFGPLTHVQSHMFLSNAPLKLTDALFVDIFTDALYFITDTLDTVYEQ